MRNGFTQIFRKAKLLFVIISITPLNAASELAPYYALSKDIKTCPTHNCYSLKWTLNKSTVFKVIRQQPRSYLLQLRSGKQYWVPKALLQGSYLSLTPSRSKRIQKIAKARSMYQSTFNKSKSTTNSIIDPKRKLEHLENLPELKKIDPWLLDMNPKRPDAPTEYTFWNRLENLPFIGGFFLYLGRFKNFLPYVILIALLPFINFKAIIASVARFRAVSALLGILGLQWLAEILVNLTSPKSSRASKQKTWSRPNAYDPKRVNTFKRGEEKKDPIMEEIIYNMDYREYVEEVKKFNEGEVTLPSKHLHELKNKKQNKRIAENTETHISVTMLNNLNTKAVKLAQFLAEAAEHKTQIIQNSLDELEDKQGKMDDDLKEQIERFHKDAEAKKKANKDQKNERKITDRRNTKRSNGRLKSKKNKKIS